MKDDLISRQAMLKHIEKKRQDALMIDDLRESNIIMMGMKLLEEAVRNQPSAQPEKMQLSKEDATKGTTFDCISRKDAIDVLHGYFDGMLETDTVCPADIYGLFECIPSAQPERLTDDDFETIRIHLNAYKENLGNQHRWEEAEEYQRIIDRFMAFASAQPEQIARDIATIIENEQDMRVILKNAEHTETHEWILCSERMPEEHEWMGTKRFGTTISDEVYVTFENPKGERFCKHLSFQNGKLSGFDQSTIDAFYKGSKPIAWMPLPKPYAERKEDASSR